MPGTGSLCMPAPKKLPRDSNRFEQNQTWITKTFGRNTAYQHLNLFPEHSSYTAMNAPSQCRRISNSAANAARTWRDKNIDYNTSLQEHIDRSAGANIDHHAEPPCCSQRHQ